MLKRICAGALLASMLLGLTACGGDTATTNPSAPAGGEASTPPPVKLWFCVCLSPPPPTTPSARL